MTLWRFIHDALDAPLSALDDDERMAGWMTVHGMKRGMRLIFQGNFRRFLFSFFFFGRDVGNGISDAIDRSIFLEWRIWGFFDGMYRLGGQLYTCFVGGFTIPKRLCFGESRVASILFGWVERPKHRDP